MSKNQFWEDLTVGQTFTTATVTVTPESIKEFAAQYDPQPIHLDDDFAAHSIFKGLIASGWQTLCLTMRLMVDLKPLGNTPMVGMGGEELRFLKPVRPGDVLQVTATVEKLWASKEGKGLMLLALRTFNQREDVISQKWVVYVPRRPA